MKNLVLMVAGIIFLLVSLMHLARLFFKVEVKVNNFPLPLWLSLCGFVFALLLAIWMFQSL